MKRVHRYPIPRPAGTFTLDLPAAGRVVHVGVVRGERSLWVEFSSSATTPWSRTFAVVGTGRDAPDGFRYVATWVEDPFVCHLFEKGK